MLIFLATLAVLAIGYPRKAARQQDARLVPAYISLLLIGLILAVLFVLGKSDLLTTLLQNVMDIFASEEGE
ncbi:hypothetical protein ABE504_01975 [Paenibacillus oryzisoli]|uniref:hypothetical protein n=1 Tax=Paenibacillus oryzisoli TaxID=1850517 RepID=UPI003D2A0B28